MSKLRIIDTKDRFLVTDTMTNSGLRTVDYATGRSIRVESAARMCVMTGFSQLTAKVNEQNAETLGTEYFEVTYHGGARPEHQEWQGKVYKKDELYSICGLGAPDGLCGCNCYHDYFPFFPGISERAYTDEELDRMNREENTPREYNGREYTAYQATQRQRSLERSMRAQRQEIHLLQTGGADDEEIMLARGKYRALSAEYTNFSKAMGIPQQRERVTVDGLGNVGAGKYTETNEPTKIPSLGSRITDKVTDEERRELLKQGVPSIGEQLVNALNARKEQVEKGVANSGESGIIKSESFNCYGDYLRDMLGSALTNNPKETSDILSDVESKGGKVVFLSNNKNMVCNVEKGKPATIEVDENISIGGLRHEYRHFLDDANNGYPGLGYYLRDRDKFFEYEKRGYEEELKIARKLNLKDIESKILDEIEKRRREIYGE